MNYARISDKPFTTHKEVLTSKKTSASAQSIRMFCKTHSVSISVDPVTKEGSATIISELASLNRGKNLEG